MDNHNLIVEKLLKDYDDNLINKGSRHTHEEVFDMHPVTAMSDVDPNHSDRVLVISDSWRPEWCKEGVQVPVKPSEEQKKPEIRLMNFLPKTKKPFQMPDRLIRSTNNYLFNPEKHIRVEEHREYLYEIDPLDCNWIQISNVERTCLGFPHITETDLEILFEVLERLCYRRIQSKIREAESEFLEHDENSKCDICQSPEGEDGNELVFCDDCFICVHQACYGIPELPAGSWICRHCEKCPKETSKCIFCPNRGGAMKQIEGDNEKWAHLSCAVWIPEVGFGNIETMEPITKISQIPQARWNLRCHLCKITNCGAPIQCAEKKCNTAFHVTCAIQNNLVMKQEFQENCDVKMLAYCKIHSKKQFDSSEIDEKISQGPRDIKELRIQKQNEFAMSFYEFVNLDDLMDPLIDHPLHLAVHLRKIPLDVCQKVYQYWKLKRTACHHQCLIKPPQIWSEEHQQQRVNNRSVFGAFCKIRFGLDRARLVIDMIVRREKKKAQLFDVMSKISLIQLQQLKASRLNPTLREDPSIAANWGILSSVHLDDNIYVNPGNLIDPNLDFVLTEMKMKHSSTLDQPSNKVKSKKKLNALSELSTRDVPPGPVNSGKSPWPTSEYSTAVMGIPESELIISDQVKDNMCRLLREPVFRCNYMVPVISDMLKDDTNISTTTIKEKEDSSSLLAVGDLPDESDSSNSVVELSFKPGDGQDKFAQPIPSVPKRRKSKSNGFDQQQKQDLLQRNNRNLFENFMNNL